MLLDKIKTATLSFGLGAFVTALAALFGCKFLAERHHIAIGDVLRYAWQIPVTKWQDDLQGVGILSLLAGVVVAVFFYLLLRNMRWNRGPRDLSSDYAAADLLALGVDQPPHIFAGKFSGKPFYASVEDRGLVIGPPGTGKTNFLLNQILRSSSFGLSFAAVDMKPELHDILAPTLKAAGYRVLRINPVRPDHEADHWNPLDDVEDEADIAELCMALLPILNPQDKPYIEAQRDWLTAAMFHIQSQPGGSLPAAYNYLSSQSQALDLLSMLEQSPSSPAARIARRLTAALGGSKPDPLILPALNGCLRTLDYLGLPGIQTALGHSDFSARELGKGTRPVALFLQFEETKAKTLGPLLAFMATGLLNTLIDTAAKRKTVALFLDELGNMPPIPGLGEKLNTIRSRCIPTWMYFQSAEQIERQYGRGATAIFFGAADLQMVFRLNDQPTRELISSLIGTTQRHKVSHSTSADSGGMRKSTTLTTEPANVIEPHQLGQLTEGQVVCLYRGEAAKGQATPHYKDFPSFRRKKESHDKI